MFFITIFFNTFLWFLSILIDILFHCIIMNLKYFIELFFFFNFSVIHSRLFFFLLIFNWFLIVFFDWVISVRLICYLLILFNFVDLILISRYSLIFLKYLPFYCMLFYLFFVFYVCFICSIIIFMFFQSYWNLIFLFLHFVVVVLLFCDIISTNSLLSIPCYIAIKFPPKAIVYSSNPSPSLPLAAILQ